GVLLRAGDGRDRGELARPYGCLRPRLGVGAGAARGDEPVGELDLDGAVGALGVDERLALAGHVDPDPARPREDPRAARLEDDLEEVVAVSVLVDARDLVGGLEGDADIARHGEVALARPRVAEGDRLLGSHEALRGGGLLALGARRRDELELVGREGRLERARRVRLRLALAREVRGRRRRLELEAR